MSIFEGTYANCKCCGDLYPADLLNETTKWCRECVRDNDLLDELMEDERKRCEVEERMEREADEILYGDSGDYYF